MKVSSKEELVVDLKVRGSLVMIQCLSSGSREQGAMQKAGPKPWTSGEQNLGSSGIYLEESHEL